jgi:porphobilinogen synthase
MKTAPVMPSIDETKPASHADALSKPLTSNAFPHVRMRRLRSSDSLRAMVRENHLRPEDMIYPLFVEENLDERTPLKTLPGMFRETEKSLEIVVKDAAAQGLKGVMLFGVSHNKDHNGSDSMDPNGLLARMIDRAKQAAPEISVIADCCFCEYTDHGHCGPLDHKGDVDNDRTIENVAMQAVIAAEAGADIIAPSGMMDGQVSAIRHALDVTGFKNTPIMAYAAKFASVFYGPFRDAAGCALGHTANVRSDRKTYQMDPANVREALREAALDEAEGADILMIKPGMPYLDILARLRQQSELPLAVYQVSGEYAMMKFAAEAGALNYEDAMMESLLAFKRAGADMILTYAGIDMAKILNK